MHKEIKDIKQIRKKFLGLLSLFPGLSILQKKLGGQLPTAINASVENSKKLKFRTGNSKFENPDHAGLKLRN